jgi:DNA-binding response OmpR family regulator
MLNNASQCLAHERPLSSGSPSFLQPLGSHPPAEPKYTVLIVDDDPDIAPLVDTALRPFNIQIEAVARGADALTRVGVCKYDLVVLDLAMSDVHGLDILRALRELPLNRNVPVLVLTANGSHEALARRFGLGADEFVRKPFDRRELGMRAFRLIRPFGQ